MLFCCVSTIRACIHTSITSFVVTAVVVIVVVVAGADVTVTVAIVGVVHEERREETGG